MAIAYQHIIINDDSNITIITKQTIVYHNSKGTTLPADHSYHLFTDTEGNVPRRCC